MSGGMVALVIASIAVVAYGLQLLSRQIQRTPVDVRRADPIIDVSRTEQVYVRPAELHQLIGIISNSLISEASQRSELQPILDELGAGAPAPATKRSRLSRARTERTRRVEQAIGELEDRWLGETTSPAGPAAEGR